MKFKLYHYWRSSSSWRVRWALAHKSLHCEYLPVNLLSDDPDSPEHLARNPMGYVPALEIIDGGTTYCLTESMAIIEWLEEKFPRSPLFPGDAFQRARIRQLCETINSGTQPLQNLNVLQHFSSDPEEQKKWAQYWIRKGLHAYEQLARGGAGRFSVGDTLTAADLFLIPQLYNARRQDVMAEAEFPLLAKVMENALQTPSAKASEPERFKPTPG